MYVSSWNSFAEEFTLMFNAEIIMWDYGTGLKEQFRIFGGYPGHYIQVKQQWSILKFIKKN